MAAQAPKTYMEGMMALLSQLGTLKAAPDANLDQLSDLEKQILTIVRAPVDTPSPGSPAGSAMDLSTGATLPPGPPPGAMSPMVAALMAQAGGGAPMGPPPAAAGSFPVHGLMASPAPPNPDEVRRMLSVAGGRGR